MIAEIVLIIIGLIVSFIAVVVCSFAKPSNKQKYSFLATISAFFYFILAFINIYSTSIDQFAFYHKFTLTAGMYMMIGFIFAISYMLNIKYSTRKIMESKLV